jgi:hypothetical protein
VQRESSTNVKECAMMPIQTLGNSTACIQYAGIEIMPKPKVAQRKMTLDVPDVLQFLAGHRYAEKKVGSDVIDIGT